MQFTNSVQFAYSVVHVCEKMDFHERDVSVQFFWNSILKS